MRYLSAAETAKLVRKSLKKAFPGTKFGVRSENGNCINVRWLDGPSDKAVQAVVGPYKGGGFDGMIDMAYGVRSWLLPDGSASFGSCTGTEECRGTVSAYENERPHPDAELVSFGSRFLFTHRDMSPAMWWSFAKIAAEELGVWGELLDGVPDAYIHDGPFKGTLECTGIPDINLTAPGLTTWGFNSYVRMQAEEAA